MKDTKKLIEELNAAVDMQHEIILGIKDLLLAWLKEEQKSMEEFNDALRISNHE